MSGCLTPFQQDILYYITIPETAVFFLVLYGVVAWFKTKKVLGFLSPSKEQPKKEEPSIDLPDISNALPPPEN